MANDEEQVITLLSLRQTIQDRLSPYYIETNDERWIDHTTSEANYER
jgi:hypothetical protein